MIAGVRRPTGDPVPGDVGEERDQRGAGVHDDGRRDQEQGRAARAHRRHGPGQDRLHAGRQQAQLGLLLIQAAGRRAQLSSESLRNRDMKLADVEEEEEREERMVEIGARKEEGAVRFSAGLLSSLPQLPHHLSFSSTWLKINLGEERQARDIPVFTIHPLPTTKLLSWLSDRLYLFLSFRHFTVRSISLVYLKFCE